MGCVRRNLPHSGWLLSQGPASVLGLSPLLSGPRSGSDSFPRERPLWVLLTRGRRPTRPARRAPRRTPRGRFGEKRVPCTCRSRRPTFIFQTRLITVHTFVHRSIAIFGPPRPRPPPTPPWPAAAPSAPPSITVLGLCFRKFPAAMNLSLLRVQSITVLCQRKRLLPGSQLSGGVLGCSGQVLGARTPGA